MNIPVPIFRLQRHGEIAQTFLCRGITDFAHAVSYIGNLPYERNTDRGNWRLVLPEHRGTCSTKHALLAALAREQGLEIALVLGIFKMCEANTPGVGAVLARAQLDWIPEAHCFLSWQGHDIDVTFAAAGSERLPKAFSHREKIEPDAIATYKLERHKEVLAEWLRGISRSDLDVDRAWAIRETCIAALLDRERAEDLRYVESEHSLPELPPIEL